MSNATSLVLRTCRADMTSTNTFRWPGVGEVAEAPDWENNTECGAGLHGWLYGAGDHGCSSFTDETSKWLVVEVESDSIVMLSGKCKFPRGTVRFVGDKKDAADFIIANEPRAATCSVIGASLVVGDAQAVQVGDLGTATAGYSGTATAGDSGTATAGYSGTATAGDRGEIRIRYWDSKAERYRTKVGYIGEDGLEAGVAYRLDDKLNFVAA